MKRRLAAACGVTAVFATIVSSAAATFPGANGAIAFIRSGTGIWTINPDGTGLTHVSPSSGRAPCDADPAFSPHGSWLLFQGCNPARHVTNVARMTSFGTKRKTIVQSDSARVSPQTPTFSPSGKRIAFAAGADVPTLFIAQSNGHAPTDTGVQGYAPTWSSLGLIAFTVPRNPRQWCNSTELDDIFAMSGGGKHLHQLTNNYGSYDPDWSPNGRHIAYARDFTINPSDYADANAPMDCLHVHKTQAPYGPEIVVANRDGTNDRRVTYAGGSHPSWSPDGKMIAFERAGYLWVMRSNGKNQRRLVRGEQPAWQPL